ncbi:MAG: NADH dehydrogenase [ubiquinone] 1 alpha subcomplex assembly factor 1 [Saprospiraceae bacterium]|jgi:NADH dehydrogenase [ubiquinone] 1 alpha subcomplex assembly factor 1
MNQFFLFLIPFLIFGNMVLFDFTKNCDLTNWRVVDDVVMGGRSDGHFDVNEAGHGIFHGKVSLENNGGFSSVRYRFDQKNVAGFTKITIRMKGDGKEYQFRVKSDQYDRHSYIYYFQTTGEWQTVEIPLNEMAPAFRGMKLRIPNYPGKVMEELAFLISNKKAESFILEIDDILLK